MKHFCHGCTDIKENLSEVRATDGTPLGIFCGDCREFLSGCEIFHGHTKSFHKSEFFEIVRPSRRTRFVLQLNVGNSDWTLYKLTTRKTTIIDSYLRFDGINALVLFSIER